MIKHFDYFRFYGILLVIACDENDKILGYFTLRDGNFLGQIYVIPSLRGRGIVHLLIWEAVDIVKKLGFSSIWGLFYDQTKGLYESYVTRWGARMEVKETPEERPDGQWNIVFHIDEITPDRRPHVC